MASVLPPYLSRQARFSVTETCCPPLVHGGWGGKEFVLSGGFGSVSSVDHLRPSRARLKANLWERSAPAARGCLLEWWWIDVKAVERWFFRRPVSMMGFCGNRDWLSSFLFNNPFYFHGICGSILACADRLEPRSGSKEGSQASAVVVRLIQVAVIWLDPRSGRIWAQLCVLGRIWIRGVYVGLGPGIQSLCALGSTASVFGFGLYIGFAIG